MHRPASPSWDTHPGLRTGQDTTRTALRPAPVTRRARASPSTGQCATCPRHRAASRCPTSHPRTPDNALNPARPGRPSRQGPAPDGHQTRTARNKAQDLLDVAGYLWRNRERMRHDHYLANGWPIASGSVEGACKNLVKDRTERSGMRWTPTAQRPCSASAPSTCHTISTSTGTSTSNATSSGSTHKAPGPSSESSHTRVESVLA